MLALSYKLLPLIVMIVASITTIANYVVKNNSLERELEACKAEMVRNDVYIKFQNAEILRSKNELAEYKKSRSVIMNDIHKKYDSVPLSGTDCSGKLQSIQEVMNVFNAR